MKTAAFVLAAIAFGMFAQDRGVLAKRNVQTWKGYVTDTWCGVNRDTKAPTSECTRECVASKGAKYAFYNLADGKVYVLNPQTEAAKYAGQRVTVTGVAGSQAIAVKTMRGASEAKTLEASAISPDQF